jgi:hypothetical protein
MDKFDGLTLVLQQQKQHFAVCTAADSYYVIAVEFF